MIRCPATTRSPAFSYSLAPDELLHHRPLGLLDLQEERVARRPGRATARPTPPCRRCRRRRPCGPGRRAGTGRAGSGARAAASACSRSRIRSASALSPSRSSVSGKSSSRTISGGSETMRRSPSTSRESFEKACTLSRRNAFATALSRRLRIFPPTCERSCGMQLLDLEAGVPDLQVAHAGELRHPGAVRGDRLEDDALLLGDREAAAPRAISMLTARRLTSHSHGPGSVSSKSLMSKTSRRSGEA